MVTTEAPELPELRVQLDHLVSLEPLAKTVTTEPLELRVQLDHLAIMEHLVKTEDLDIQVQ